MVVWLDRPSLLTALTYKVKKLGRAWEDSWFGFQDTNFTRASLIVHPALFLSCTLHRGLSHPFPQGCFRRTEPKLAKSPFGASHCQVYCMSFSMLFRNKSDGSASNSVLLFCPKSTLLCYGTQRTQTSMRSLLMPTGFQTKETRTRATMTRRNIPFPV
jgi:hypothetical protein